MIKNISNLGDAALYCDFGKEVNKEINTEVIKYFKTQFYYYQLGLTSTETCAPSILKTDSLALPQVRQWTATQWP